MAKDTILYDRLNINSNSTPDEIKKSYRKLSLKWHPDKNKDKEHATRKFQEISEAYSILSDPKKRQIYDQIGYNMMKEGGGENNFDPSSIFEQFFGGGMGGMGGFGFPFDVNRSRSDSKENCTINLAVTLEQIYNEEKIKVNYKQKVYCKNCNGFGTNNGKKSICSKCNGKGKVMKVRRMGPLVQQMVGDCDICRGTGELINNNNKCKECNGQSYNIRNKTFNLPLKNGLKTGNKIKLDKKGHIFKDYKTDLIIEVIQKPHNIFKREDKNLIIEIELKLYQSLIGFDKIIKHLDGRELHLSYRNIIKEGDIKRIKNEGMIDLNDMSKGDLHIIFTINYPDLTRLSKNESNLLKVLLAKMNEDELDKETKIITNKDKYIETKLLNSSLENINNNQNSEDYHNGEPQCVQQ
jgi:DnaJ homolog subfamily A member 2